MPHRGPKHKSSKVRCPCKCNCKVCFEHQSVLRISIFLVAVFLLTMGIGMLTVSLSGILKMNSIELQKTADLLKVPTSKTEDLTNLHLVIGITGYGTVNIGVVSLCAVTGRRQVHSSAGAVGAAAGAAAYLYFLTNYIKPRLQAVIRELDTALLRYFKAFRQTGDEKFLTQIHMHSDCCGLNNGASDFQEWGWPLPSSCCNMFSGNCSLSLALRRDPCRSVVRRLIGRDGLFDLGYLSTVLGVTCSVLGFQLLILIFFPGRDAVNWASVGMRMATAGGRSDPQEKADRMGQAASDNQDAYGGEGHELEKELTGRRASRQTKLLSALATATIGIERDRIQFQQLLDDDVRMRTGPRRSDVEQEAKLAQELDTERRRLIGRKLGQQQQQKGK